MNCQTCKYETPNCIRGYWTYREIIFCYRQILFILENYEEERWPSDPAETGYTGGTGRKGIGNASFVRWREIRGEVSRRLSMCAQLDGAMLYQTYVLRLKVEDIAKSFNCSVEEVERRVRSALAYITGWRRKRREYAKFVFDWEKRKSNPKTEWLETKKDARSFSVERVKT